MRSRSKAAWLPMRGSCFAAAGKSEYVDDADQFLARPGGIHQFGDMRREAEDALGGSGQDNAVAGIIDQDDLGTRRRNAQAEQAKQDGTEQADPVKVPSRQP